MSDLSPDEVERELAMHDRPQTRAECIGGERPCPWVGCKHHLYLDVNPLTGTIRICYPDLEPWELEHTCSLDVAELGGITLEELGQMTNLTRERIRQIETKGLFMARARAMDKGIAADDSYFAHVDGNGPDTKGEG